MFVSRTGEEESTMSASVCSALSLMKMVRSVVPRLSQSAHKGECGRLGVVGGCREYTGAPYFAAITGLRVGGDLSHVFCTEGAAPVIKAYSPELIVHPLLDDAHGVVEMEDWLPRLHSVVLGPGLGRSQPVCDNARTIVQKVIQAQLPLVIDADGLFVVTNQPDIISGYNKAILTPNVVEFKRLYKQVMSSEPVEGDSEGNVTRLSEKLGNVTIVQKGETDIISDGRNVLVCREEGSARRCGGQGDLLSGSMAVFAYWAHKTWAENSNINEDLAVVGPNLCAAYAACCLTRRCNKLAYERHGRSMITSDMIEDIHTAFSALFE